MSSQREPTAKATSNIKIQMIEGQISYTTRLQQIHTLLAQENPPSADEVQSLLGHGVLAGLFHQWSILLSCCYSCEASSILIQVKLYHVPSLPSWSAPKTPSGNWSHILLALGETQTQLQAWLGLLVEHTGGWRTFPRSGETAVNSPAEHYP